MRRYQHAERMIRGIPWQGKKELYAVLLRDLKRTDTTASVSKRDGLCRTFVMFQDYMKTIRREKVRCTDKTVQAQHLDALKDKDAIMAEVKAQYYPEGEDHAQA